MLIIRMRKFFYTFRLKFRHQKSPHFQRNSHLTLKMSASTTSALLYTASVSSPQVAQAVPQDAKELRHHVKGGKGFINPWSSYRENMPGFQIGFTMLW